MPANIVQINGSDEHEWIVSDSKMDGLIAFLDAIGERVWLLCDSDVADQYRTKTVVTNGEWSPWQEMPADLKGKRTYPAFANMVQHRCRKESKGARDE